MKLESNINQVVLNLTGKLKGIAGGELTRLIATDLLASNNRRIHNDGIAVNGAKIGNYSIKPMYANPKVSPKKFTGIGKTGRTKFLNGKQHVTRYFKTGYRGFRSFVGREVSVVNLQLSGKLKLDWVMQPQGKNFLLGFKSKYGSEVSRGNEQRFGKRIWGVTKKDEADIKIIVEDFINKKLNAGT